MAYFTGSAVWAHTGWVGRFFPKGTQPAGYLREYARRLTAVEGNTTFYATPSPTTVARWREDTPRGFRFCPKLPRSVSHAGLLMPHLAETLRFVELMRGLGARLGPLFLQLPPRYSPRLINDLRSFLTAWPRDAKLAVEVRHMDWFVEPQHSQLNALLRDYDAAHVLIDTRPIRDLPESAVEAGQVKVLMDRARERKPDVPLLPVRSASFAMLRYIGHPDVGLNAPLLEEWADRLASWLTEGADIYAFCHCPDETMSPHLCRELHRRVAARAPLDPLPWDVAGETPPFEQGTLF